MKKSILASIAALAVGTNAFAANYGDGVPTTHTGTDFKSQNMWMVMGQECPLDVFIKPDHQSQTIKSTNWKVGVGKIGAGYNYGGWDDGFNLANMGDYAIKDNSGGIKSGESVISYPESQYYLRIFSNSDMIDVFVVPPKDAVDNRSCGIQNSGSSGGGTDGATSSNPYAQTKSTCIGLGERIDKIKIMAGISVGAGAVGTLAGGAAATAGFMKSAADKKAAEPQANVQQESLAEGVEQPVSEEQKASFKDKIVGAAPTIQTAGSFTAGGTAAVGAITSFVGASQFDELIKDMDNCIESVKQLEKKKMELTFDSPDDPNIARYGKIVDNCSGFNTKNIKDIKAAMTTSGVFSTIGALAGIAGGVTSVVANKQPTEPSVEGEGPDKAKLGTATNVLSTASAATSLISTIISGATLAGLNKNSQIADKCKESF